jgi:hypothetical protein
MKKLLLCFVFGLIHIQASAQHAIAQPVPAPAIAIPTTPFFGSVNGDNFAMCRTSSVSIQFVPQADGAYRLNWVESGWLAGPRAGFCENRLDGMAYPTARPNEYSVRFYFLQMAGLGRMTVTANQIEVTAQIWNHGTSWPIDFVANLAPYINANAGGRIDLDYRRTVRNYQDPDLYVIGRLLGP